MKLSAKLLIGIFLFFIVSIFASNLLLKEEYQKFQTRDKSKKYNYHTQLTNQPFKHVKIENGNAIGEIILEQDTFFATYYNENNGYEPNRKQEGKMAATIIGDTLFVNVPSEKYNRWNSNSDVVHIFAPRFESITCKDSRLKVIHLNQKELNVSLLGHSIVGVLSDTMHTDVLNVRVDAYSKFRWANANIFQKVNAQLSEGSELDLSETEVNSLIFNEPQKSSIKLSSKTLRHFMK